MAKCFAQKRIIVLKGRNPITNFAIKAMVSRFAQNRLRLFGARDLQILSERSVVDFFCCILGKICEGLILVNQIKDLDQN